MSVVPHAGNGKITVPDILSRKTVPTSAIPEKQQKITCITAYDYPTARLLDDAGIDMLLVGDSLGMVVQGHPDSLGVTLDEVIYHTRMVVRGARRSFWRAKLTMR